MKKAELLKMAKGVRTKLAKHSPEILTGIGIAGMISTTVLAVKATPKAIQILEEERQNRKIDRENGVDEEFAPEKISVIDTVKLCWKPYLPAAITGTLSVACIIGASSVNAKRNAALATAYTLSETALSEYREKVIETIGEKKEKQVRDKVAKDKVDKNPVSKSEVIVTGKGNTLCYDALGGGYFRSDYDHIKKVENILNRKLINEMYVSLNEMYDELGINRTRLGDDLGWNMDDGYIEIDLSSQLADDGTPCLVVDYSVAPRYNFSKLS